MCDNKFSFIYLLKNEIIRGFHEKYFWIIICSIFLFCTLSVAINAVYPLSLFYNGKEQGLFIWGHWGFTISNACKVVLDNTLWKVYFPFIVTAAYAHVLPDERKDGYASQLIMKEGFPQYFVSKLCAISFMGGVLGAAPIILVFLISFFGIRYNPFFKDAVLYFEKEQELELFHLTWNGNIILEQLSLTSILLIGMCCWFLLGTLFGLLGGILGIFIDNKLLIYMMPVVGLQLWDLCIYLQPFPQFHKAYIKNYMGFINLGNLDVISIWIYLFLLLVGIIIIMYPKAKTKYSEGKVIC